MTCAKFVASIDDRHDLLRCVLNRICHCCRSGFFFCAPVPAIDAAFGAFRNSFYSGFAVWPPVRCPLGPSQTDVRVFVCESREEYTARSRSEWRNRLEFVELVFRIDIVSFSIAYCKIALTVRILSNRLALVSSNEDIMSSLNPEHYSAASRPINNRQTGQGDRQKSGFVSESDVVK